MMMCNFKLIVACVCLCVCACADSSRVKRMCVAERRQPYSGADWCSGGESDEDDKGFFSKCANVCIQAGAAIPLPIRSTHGSSRQFNPKNKRPFAGPKLCRRLPCLLSPFRLQLK